MTAKTIRSENQTDADLAVAPSFYAPGAACHPVARLRAISTGGTQMKRCVNCGEVKLLSEFFAAAGGPYGLRGSCKECDRKYQRRYRQKNRRLLREKQRQFQVDNEAAIHSRQQTYHRLHPEKAAARCAVRDAFRAGKLMKGMCEVHGADCTGEVEAHHDDYSKPLDVRWVCVSAHHRLHAVGAKP